MRRPPLPSICGWRGGLACTLQLAVPPCCRRSSPLAYPWGRPPVVQGDFQDLVGYEEDCTPESLPEMAVDTSVAYDLLP